MAEDPRLEELRALGAQIGTGIFLGPDVYVEREFASLLTLEHGVVVSRGVSIILHDSALNNVAGERVKFGRVVLRRECYVGVNATILCGVEIGARAVVGACSVVTHDVPPDTVAYGHPARPHGPVRDLVEKHRGLAQTSERFRYMDIIPWRERREGPAAARAVEDIAAFLATTWKGERR